MRESISTLSAPGGIDVRALEFEFVDVRGQRLRELRELANLRLEDIALATHLSVPTVHRIERSVRRRLSFTTLLRAIGTLDIPLGVEVTPATWEQALSREALLALLSWRFADAARILDARAVIVSGAARATQLEGEILREWARAAMEGRDQPETMAYLAVQARGENASRAAAWASVLAAGMYGRAGDLDRALAALAEADRACATEDDLAIVHAAIGRELARAGDAEGALVALAKSRVVIGRAWPYGQARWNYVEGMIHFELGAADEAERSFGTAVERALQVPNHRLASAIERVRASLHESRGQTDGADLALVRAARFASRAGNTGDSAAIWSSMIERPLIGDRSAIAVGAAMKVLQYIQEPIAL